MMAMDNRHLNYLSLLAGLAFLLFANGNAAPAAAWLAPVFVMRFTRQARNTAEVLAAMACVGLAHIASLYGPFSNDFIPPVMRVAYCVGYGMFLYFPPFIADRLLSRRLQGFPATLVFPAAFVTLEYANSLVSPFATFGLLAYTQYGNLPLMQVVSVTGIWGLGFLMTWFAAAANQAWECDFELQRIKWPLLTYAVVMIIVLMYGGIRLQGIHEGGTVRVAVSSLSYDARGMFKAALKTGQSPDLSANMRAFDAFMESAGSAGAAVALWQEYALIVDESDVDPLLRHVSRSVDEHDMYCTLPVGVVVKRDGRRLLRNMVYLFNPEGETIAEYIKTFTAPWESSENRDREAAMVQTGIGGLALAICFDMDFPCLIRQAGAGNADIMLAPSMDWRGLVPFHSHMAVFRAIENGFSLARSSGARGVSIAADPYGRVLGYLDNSTSRDRLMVVDLPARGVRTIYSRIGDSFAWLCVATLLGFIVLVLYRKKNRI